MLKQIDKFYYPLFLIYQITQHQQQRKFTISFINQLYMDFIPPQPSIINNTKNGPHQMQNIAISPLDHFNIFDDFKLKQTLINQLKIRDSSIYKFKLYRKNKTSKWEEQNTQLIRKRKDSSYHPLTPTIESKPPKASFAHQHTSTFYNQTQNSSSLNSKLIQKEKLSFTQKIYSHHSTRPTLPNHKKLSNQMTLLRDNLILSKEQQNPRYKMISNRTRANIINYSLKKGEKKLSKKSVQKDSQKWLQRRAECSSSVREKGNRSQRWSQIEEDERDLQQIEQQNIFYYMKSQQLRALSQDTIQRQAHIAPKDL